jgi:hypothetical protein
MALTGLVTTILPTGAPALTPAGTVVSGPGDVQEPAFVGTQTVIGDSSVTTVTVNWIDGTQTIPFTPKAIVVTGIPALTGTADATGVLQAEGSNAAPRVKNITNTSFQYVYSTAVANNSSASVLFVVYR